MKKIIAALMLCFVSIYVFSQIGAIQPKKQRFEFIGTHICYDTETGEYDMIVSSDDCPIEMKIELSILQTMKATSDALRTLCEPIATDKASISLAEKKALLEYLTLVKAGIEQYKIHKTEE